MYALKVYWDVYVCISVCMCGAYKVDCVMYVWCVLMSAM